MSARRGLLISAAAGVLLGLCFPPFDVPWPAMLMAIALWFTTTSGIGLRQRLFHSFVFALCFYLVLLRWMVAIGWDAWLALAVLEALFFLPVAWIRGLAKSQLASALLVVAAWPGMDWIRDHAGPVAFGWGQLAFATIDAPWSSVSSSQWSSTAMIVALGCAAAVILTGGAALRLVALGTLLLGLTLPSLQSPAPTASVREYTVALVQGGVDRTGIGNLGDRRAVMRRHARLSVSALRTVRTDLVVWPENSVDVDPFSDAEARATTLLVARELKTPLLFGAVLESPEGRKNAAVLTNGSTLTLAYAKQRLVPFGEVLPARDLMTRWFERTRHVPMDFVPGATPGRIRVGGLRLGVVICFEIADGGVVAEALAGGASVLIAQTNNATYAGLGQAQQQVRIAQFRARSLRIPVLLVSTTGPTVVIDSTGRIVQAIDEGDTGVLIAKVPASRLSP